MENAPRATIVVPTLNESENVPVLIERIGSIRSRCRPYDLRVLVIDASSSDGTGDVVTDLARTHPWLSLYTRAPGGGLGDVYKDGIRHAMGQGAHVVFEMDADLSHDPDRIPAMLERISSGSDFVIGSRYVEGGSLPENWPIKRRVISRLANAGARTVLGLGPKDCSGGYRAIRREVLEHVDIASIEASGYGFQIELLYRAYRAGATLDEVPIAFADRTSGESKMRLFDWWEMARLVFTLRFARRYAASAPHPADA